MRWVHLAAIGLVLGLAACATRGPTPRTEAGTSANGEPGMDRITELDQEIASARKLIGLDPPDGSMTQATTATCTDVCTYADQICRAQEEICTLAPEVGTQWAQEKCEKAERSCREAKQRCEDCE